MYEVGKAVPCKDSGNVPGKAIGNFKIRQP